nr:hypothetical protein [Pseudomonas sp. RW407]
MHVPLSNIPGHRAYVKFSGAQRCPVRPATCPVAGEESHHG